MLFSKKQHSCRYRRPALAVSKKARKRCDAGSGPSHDNILGAVLRQPEGAVFLKLDECRWYGFWLIPENPKPFRFFPAHAFVPYHRTAMQRALRRGAHRVRSYE